ncbi:hypothetical protein [Methyloligella solikamskensis]|uniref:Uncharacterized protein n=1 Tax=Methyloligella solikamskensis TaxID=1177756 RepID=A0ABW3JEK1_9HYPH
MTLQVTFNGQILFEDSNEENVLVPYDDGERANAFYALTNALAILSGVTPRCSRDATEDATDEHCSGSEPNPVDHKDGVVVPLRGRQAD